MKHYVIGDVHGMLPQLLALLSKLPDPAKIIFCGDLIDRGPYSAQVVEYVRRQGHSCVRGNHEEAFIAFFRDYLGGMNLESAVHKWAPWLILNGGSETLRSYGFWEDPEDAAVLERIRRDMEWMASLPLYIELGPIHPGGLPAVVSHSNITGVWHLRHNPEYADLFAETALRARDMECHPQSGIFNIFGHTPLPIRRIEPNCVDVDGGCCYQKEELGRLVAYCVEDESFTIQNCRSES